MLEILLLLVLVVGFAWQRGNDRRLRKLETELDEVKRALAAQTPARTTTEVLAAMPLGEGTPAGDDPLALARQETTPTSPGSMSATAQGKSTTTEPLPPVTPAKTLGKNAESLESRLGARWAVWIGGLALAFGGIFMVKYSIESGLLSPAVRLALASLFGIILLVAGEFVRRIAPPDRTAAFQNAMVPGILTAAGAVTLFGGAYAAYGFYAFIGSVPAFALMALVALLTLALSLLHGQALAGLGLLGSMVTPMLIATAQPDIGVLFGYLTIAWLATAAAARQQRWQIVPALANTGLTLWAISYLVTANTLELLPVTLSLLAMIGGTIFLWPGRHWPRTPDEPTEDNPAALRRMFGRPGAWELLFTRPPLAITLTLSVGTLLISLLLAAAIGPATIDPAICFAAIVATLATLGASRVYAAIPASFAATAAIAGTGLLSVASLYPDLLALPATPVTSVLPPGYGRDIAISLGLGSLFVLCGFAFLRRYCAEERQYAMLWAVIMTLVPIAIATISFVNYGDLNRDWSHGLYGLLLGAILLTGAECLARRQPDTTLPGPLDVLITGSYASFTFALHALTNSGTTTVLIAVLGFAYLLAAKLRPWPALPWMMVAAGIIVLARIGVEPSIVGPQHLGRTPLFNALLAGYGIPALLTTVSAYILRDRRPSRVLQMLEALASILCLLTIAILVRHAMHGGILAGTAPSLGEQSIYTLLAIGGAGILMALDMKSPGPVFHYGSMVLGGLSILSILTLHFLVLNPFLTGESTGHVPFFNLLLIGYLLPAVGYAGLAVYARGKRPLPYVVLLALAGIGLGFAWATLSVRRFWQGENIAEWKGFFPGETYSYSVVWLLIGVAFLGLGTRFDAKSLRLASAGLVLIAVVKVFLIDMSNLEGFLRALSFIGLGVVLIGIGLFYQKILTGKDATALKSPPDDGGSDPGH